jgi:large subunit ribosomal protein L24e
MPTTRTCDFSGETIEPGTGIMYVRNDGTVLHFKDAKCEKNYFMGREARNLEWTESGQREEAQAQPATDVTETEVEAEEAESEAGSTPDIDIDETTDAGVEGEPGAADQSDEEEAEMDEITGENEEDEG